MVVPVKSGATVDDVAREVCERVSGETKAPVAQLRLVDANGDMLSGKDLVIDVTDHNAMLSAIPVEVDPIAVEAVKAVYTPVAPVEGGDIEPSAGDELFDLLEAATSEACKQADESVSKEEKGCTKVSAKAKKPKEEKGCTKVAAKAKKPKKAKALPKPLPKAELRLIDGVPRTFLEFSANSCDMQQWRKAQLVTAAETHLEKVRRMNAEDAKKAKAPKPRRAKAPQSVKQRMELEEDMVGTIIGKKGATIEKLQQAHAVKIIVSKKAPFTCTVQGKEENVADALAACTLLIHKKKEDQRHAAQRRQALAQMSASETAIHKAERATKRQAAQGDDVEIDINSFGLYVTGHWVQGQWMPVKKAAAVASQDDDDWGEEEHKAPGMATMGHAATIKSGAHLINDEPVDCWEELVSDEEEPTKGAGWNLVDTMGDANKYDEAFPTPAAASQQ